MKVTAGVFQQLQFKLTLLLLAVVLVAGAMYWNSFQQQRQYLTSRDFRLLTVLATQVQNIIDGHARIFQSTSGACTDATQTRPQIRQRLPRYRDVKEWRDDASRALCRRCGTWISYFRQHHRKPSGPPRRHA